MAQGKQPHFLESTVVAHYLPPSCHLLMAFGFASNLTALSAMLALGLYMKSVRLVSILVRLLMHSINHHCRGNIPLDDYLVKS